MSEDDPKPAGLLASFHRIADSLLGLIHNRTRLFALELQAERLRIIENLLRLSVALMVGGVALALASATLALYLWETTGFMGLVFMTATFAAVALTLFWRLKRRLQKDPAPFAETVAEFKKDRACLLRRD